MGEEGERAGNERGCMSWKEAEKLFRCNQSTSPSTRLTLAHSRAPSLTTACTHLLWSPSSPFLPPTHLQKVHDSQQPLLQLLLLLPRSCQPGSLHGVHMGRQLSHGRLQLDKPLLI